MAPDPQMAVETEGKFLLFPEKDLALSVVYRCSGAACGNGHATYLKKIVGRRSQSLAGPTLRQLVSPVLSAASLSSFATCGKGPQEKTCECRRLGRA